MAKYTSDPNLIRGAGIASRDWSNVPGMYAGLDKGIKTAQEAITKAFEEKAKEKKKADDQIDAWWDIANPVYENAGSFMKTPELDSVHRELEQMGEDINKAKESGDRKAESAARISFNNLKGEIDEHKAFRETITDPEYGLSDAMNGSGIVGGNNGKDLEFMTALMKEDYTVSRNKEGVKTYTIGGVSKTMKEIKGVAIVKDNIPFAAYGEKLTKATTARKFNREATDLDIRNNVIPQDINGLRAFMADNGFGGTNFLGLLNKPAEEGGISNRQNIEEEIKNNILFNPDGDDIIDETEWENFTNAIVDPYNKMWKKADGSHDQRAWQKHATNIAAEQLANGIENTWNVAHPEEEEKISGGRGKAARDTIFLEKLGQYVDIGAYNDKVSIFNNARTGTVIPSFKYVGGFARDQYKLLANGKYQHSTLQEDGTYKVVGEVSEYDAKFGVGMRMGKEQKMSKYNEKTSDKEPGKESKEDFLQRIGGYLNK